MDGYEHVSAAHELLCDTDPSPRERLEGAAVRLWSALPHAEDWPPPLRRRAVAVSSLLFHRGSIEATVRAMTEGEIASTLEQLEGFTEHFLGSCGVGRAG